MKHMRLTASALIALAGISSVAFGDGRITMSDATGFYNGTDGQGGAFTATAPSSNAGYNGLYGGNLRSGDGRGTGSNSFLTFCIEYNEHIGFGTTYYTQIATSASNGGVGGGHPDPISGATAAVYREFRRAGTNTVLFGGARLFGSGTANYNFSSNNSGGGFNTSEETSAIQHAIWSLEGEITLDANNRVDQLAQLIVNWGMANDHGLQGVRVMRLWTNRSGSNGNYTYSGFAQDQLTLVPLPPASLAGLGMLAGVASFGVIRRRKLNAR